MAACLRSAVGFYNGGGVTPVPTPVPTTDLATYREIEWNGAPVKVLCDDYGRLFTRYDSANNFYNGVAWTDEGLDKTFDSIEGHEEAFMGLIQTYGHNDAVTGEGVDNVVINLDGTSTEFTFADGQCVPVPSLWQQGTVKTLFYRTLNDGSNDINVLCDTDGKLIVGDGAEPSYLEYMLANDQIGFRTANRNALITAAGGSVVADIFSDNDGNYILVSLDDYTVVADLDGIVVIGDITEWPAPPTVQIYGDRECSVRPTGMLATVYAKVNRPLKWNETFVWNPRELTILRPEEFEIPEVPYSIRWYEGYQSEDIPCPNVDSVIEAGIYELNQSYARDTSDLVDIFY